MLNERHITPGETHGAGGSEGGNALRKSGAIHTLPPDEFSAAARSCKP